MTTTTQQRTQPRTQQSRDTAPERHHGWKLEGWVRLQSLKRDINQLSATKNLRHETKGELDQLYGDAERALATHQGPDVFWQVTHRLEERVAAATGICEALLVDYVAWAVRHMEDPLTKKHPQLFDAPAHRAVLRCAQEPKRRPRTPRRSSRPTSATSSTRRTRLQDEEHWLRNEQNSRLKVAAIVAACLSGLVVVMSVLLDELPFLVGAEQLLRRPGSPGGGARRPRGLVGGSWGALAGTDERTQRPVPDSTGPRGRPHVHRRPRRPHRRLAHRCRMGHRASTADTAPALFSAAVAFGLTQEPITRVLEDRASKATQDRRRSDD